MKEKNPLLIFAAITFAIFLLFTSLGAGNAGPQSSPSVPLVQNTAASVPTSYSFYHYDPANAVAYAKLVDSKYYHQKYYPSGNGPISVTFWPAGAVVNEKSVESFNGLPPESTVIATV